MSQQNRADRSDGTQQDDRRPDPSRRSVLHGAAGIAGAGLVATAIGTLAAPAVAASDAPRAHPGQAARAPGSADPVIVHVRDLRSGEIDVFAGETKATLRDPGLAAKLAHAVH
jgi:hypothetical protein